MIYPTPGYYIPVVYKLATQDAVHGPDYSVLQTLPIDTTLTPKGTYFQVPIYSAWLPYLGEIVFLWGAFEVNWNSFFETMCAANGVVPEQNWKKRKGKKRCQMFLDRVDATFSPGTSINNYLHELVRDSIVLQNRRNLLLHGRVHLVMGGPDPHMVVEGFSSDGQPERHEYREVDIKRLFQELSHLVGRFTPLFFPQGSVAQQFPSHDRSLLQQLWQKVQTSPPNPKTP